MPIHIRQGRPEEYSKLIDLTATAFNEPRSGFTRDYGNAYPSTKTTARRIMVAEQHEEIVGLVNVTPMTFRIGGCAVPGNGVGGVATMLQHRGKGVMRSLLKALPDYMQDHGQVMSILWGHRSRYNHEGWEISGIETWFRIHRKLLLHHQAPKTMAIRRATSKDSRIIGELCRRRTWGLQRNGKDIALLLRRPQFQVFLCRGEGKVAFIISKGDNPTRVIESGGHLPLITALLVRLLKRHHADWVEIAVPTEDQKLRQYLWPMTQEWRNQCIGQVRITGLAHFLKAIEPVLHRRLRSTRFKSFALHTTDTNQTAMARIHRDRLQVSECCEDRRIPQIQADELNMTRLLLGSPEGGICPSVISSNQNLLNIFPFPWWFSAWDQV